MLYLTHNQYKLSQYSYHCGAMLHTKIMTRKSRIVFTHAALWLVYFTYEYGIADLIGQYPINLLETLLNFLLYIGLFYSYTLFLLPRFLSRQDYGKFVAYALLVTGLFVLLRYETKVVVIPFLSNQELLYPYQNLRVFLAETLWRGGYFLIIALGYWFANKSVQQEREKRQLEQQKRRDEQRLRIMEASLKDAEIAYLKNQINPHFLFNTLNFFYDQIRPHSDRIAEGVLLLSKIMRYALMKNEADDKVMLEDAIEHVKDYIAINQLRFNNRLQVQFEVVGNPAFRMIIPLVLITFVENCFKYGDLFDPQHPLQIKLEVTNDQLAFFTHNKKKHGPVEQSTGIGIANTRQRLDIVYGNQYTLEIENCPDFYTTILTINL